MLRSQTIPLVTIITPSYNQAAFIQQTIESVLRQNYPAIEHIVVDGGSQDGTLDILQRYSKLGDRFRYISEPDRGQSHAINKGLQMARGEMIGWLNSDDTYFPQAVQKAVQALVQHPEWAMVYGRGLHINEQNAILHKYPWTPFDRKKMFHHCIICQPTAFIRKSVFEAVGGVDEELHFCMDYDLWLRISAEYQIGYIEDYIATSRLHSRCKSVTSLIDVGFPEIVKTSFKHFGTVSNEWLLHFLRTSREKGAHWFLELFKTYQLFGKTPRLAATNRYSDGWAPPVLNLSIEIDSQTPLHALLVKGSQSYPSEPLHFRVQAGERILPFSSQGHNPFTLEIPLSAHGPDCTVNITCSRQLDMKHPESEDENRTVSYLAEHILPLSQEEFRFYQEFHKGSTELLEWMKQNRQPTPVL